MVYIYQIAFFLIKMAVVHFVWSLKFWFNKAVLKTNLKRKSHWLFCKKFYFSDLIGFFSYKRRYTCAVIFLKEIGAKWIQGVFFCGEIISVFTLVLLWVLCKKKASKSHTILSKHSSYYLVIFLFWVFTMRQWNIFPWN